MGPDLTQAAPSAEQRPPRLVSAQALLAGLPDPVLVVDGQGLVLEANAAARVLLPSLSLGYPLSYGLRAPDILEAVAAARTTGRTAHVEYRQRVPVARVFDVQIGPLPLDAGAAPGNTGVLLFFRDLTAARHLEQMRVDFVANVSHELRTPLASLIGFIETLQGPARDDPAAGERFLAIMRDQAWRMTRLIDDLLSLSRIELRENVAPNAPVDLRAVAGQMIEALNAMSRDRGVTIAFRAADAPWLVLGDRDELLRVVENLVENAVKYGGSGGRVEVEMSRNGREIELSVRDYGPGIAEEHIPRLTERFYRVDVAGSRAMGGTGLGLAIVKHIVNRHRGRLAIESEPGKGSLFRITLPAYAGGQGAS